MNSEVSHSSCVVHATTGRSLLRVRINESTLLIAFMSTEECQRREGEARDVK
jgi:hypothetical protein